MDPNVTLRELRQSQRWATNIELPDSMRRSHYNDVIDLFNILDEWLSKGGFLPTDWERK